MASVADPGFAKGGIMASTWYAQRGPGAMHCIAPLVVGQGISPLKLKAVCSFSYKRGAKS